MNEETICYAIKLTDGKYASFYQEYDGADVQVSSVEDISKAEYWDENWIHRAFDELVKGKNKDDVYFTLRFGVTPLKIVRVIIKVEEEWE